MIKYLSNANIKANKIKISNKLFYSTIDLLENLEVEDFDNDIVQLYGYVAHAFNNKKLIVELRDSYRDIISSNIVRNPDECYACTCHYCDNVPF
jgi:hypothetical protein